MQGNFFAPVAQAYAQFRPRYPEELFAYLASLAPGHALAWDCATGSGQAAHGLVPHFDRIVATDSSAEQLAQAAPHARITYRQADALQSGLADGSVDLVTVAQAMHWFHGGPFEREVRRVLRPGGIIAAWSYNFAEVSPAVDVVMRHVHDDIVGPFWGEPNRIVERGYVDLHFPFDRLPPPAFVLRTRMDMPAFLGFLGTWSAITKYRRHHGTDPLAGMRPRLLEAWGAPDEVREVVWPLVLLVGRV